MLTRRLISRQLVALVLLTSILLNRPVGAQTLSIDEAVTPGPNGGARLIVNGLPKYFVFSRNSASKCQYRTTDGQNYSAFAPVGAPNGQGSTISYPAAATVYNSSGVPISISAFVRASDQQIWVTSLTNPSGTTLAWQNWKPLGVFTSAAPAAAWYVGSSGGGMNVFYKDLTTGRMRSIVSPDGYNTWGSVIDLSNLHVDGTETMTSGPVALVSTTVGASQIPFLQLFFRSSIGNLVRDASTFNPATPSSWAAPPLSHDIYKTSPLVQLNSSDDPCIVSNVGGVMTASDPTNFLSYQIAEQLKMNAGVVKFQMSYDKHWNGDTPPAKYTCSFSDILAAGQAGAKVIILRTAESKTKTGNIDKFMNTMKFPDTNGPGKDKSIKDLPNLYSLPRYVIEIGNEPNQALGGRKTDGTYNFPAATARDQAVAAGVYIQSKFSSTSSGFKEWNKFKWIVSFPIIGDDVAYLNTFMTTASTPNNTKTVFDVFNGFGVHAYSFGTLYWNNSVSTTQHPQALLDNVLARLPYGADVFVTECNTNTPGINFPDWQTNGTRLKQVLYATPACVRSWTYFALDTGPTFNIAGHDCYGIDEKAGQVILDVKALWLLEPGNPPGKAVAYLHLPLPDTSCAVGDDVVISGCESIHSPTNSDTTLNGYWKVAEVGPNGIYVEANITGWTTTAYPTGLPSNDRPGRFARVPLKLETSPVSRPCATTLGTR